MARKREFRLFYVALPMLLVALTAVSQLGAAETMEDANRLFNQGLEAYKTKKLPEAIKAWAETLRICQSLKDTEHAQADCYKNIGLALARMGKYTEALTQQQGALGVYQKLKDADYEQAGCYGNIGNVLAGMGKYTEALARQQQAMKMFESLSATEHEQAVCAGDIGNILRHMAKYDEAIPYYRKALRAYGNMPGTEREEAACNMHMGSVLSKVGKFEKAIYHYKRALRIIRKIPSADREKAALYIGIGAQLGAMGVYEEAIACQQEALQIVQAIPGCQHVEAICYENIGNVLWFMRDYEEALAQYEKALQIFLTIKDSVREQAGCHGNIGNVYWLMGKHDQALAQYEKAIGMFQAVADSKHEQAIGYRNIGVALSALGKYPEALARLRKSLQMFQAIKGTEDELSLCWANIALCHTQAGHFADAVIAFEEARRLSAELRLSSAFGRAYQFRGFPGDDRKAVEQFLNAVEWAEADRAKVKAYEHQTAVFEQSTTVFADFVSLLGELATRRAVIEAPDVLRWADSATLESGLRQAAFHFADQGKGRSLNDSLRERASPKTSRADIKLLAEDKGLSQQISKLTTMREELPDAETERKKKLTQDIEELQQRRNMIEVEIKKTTLGAYVAPDFRKPMEMAAELPTDTAVLQYSVAEKEIWLLILTRNGVTAHKLGCEVLALPELRLRQQATLGQLLDAWQKRPEQIGLDGFVRLARERAEDLARPERAISTPVLDDMMTRAKESTGQPTERHNLVDALTEQAILARLGNNVLPTAALAELRQKKIHHLLVIPDGSLHCVPFAMLRVDGVMEQGSAGVLGRGSVGVLGQKHYLIEEFSVSYTPAMTTLETIRKQKKEREQKRKMERHQLLAFANPAYGSEDVSTPPAKMAGDDMVTRLRSVRNDYYKSGGLRLTSLPETEQEAIRVASVFAPPKQCSDPTAVDTDASALVLTSKAASEEQAKRLLSSQPSALSSQPGSPVTSHQLPITRWKYLLFSTHGFADSHNGMLSCLALSSPAADSAEDGFLQAQEVLDLELDTDLVMLSACQTGLGRMRGGEGLVGLSASFFIAGAESVCASLWQVPSGPTSQLVPEFFRHLKEGKLNRAEALRQAQLTVMRSGQMADGKSADYSSPFCWAAFVLCGDYGGDAGPPVSHQGQKQSQSSAASGLIHQAPHSSATTNVVSHEIPKMVRPPGPVTVFPGKPSIGTFSKDKASLVELSQLSENEFSINYDVSERGSRAGVVIDFTRAHGGTQDMSEMKGIGFEMKLDFKPSKHSHCAKIEIKDTLGNAALFWINDLTTNYQTCAVPTPIIRQYFPSFDLTHISEITLVLEGDKIEHRKGRLDIKAGGIRATVPGKPTEATAPSRPNRKAVVVMVKPDLKDRFVVVEFTGTAVPNPGERLILYRGVQQIGAVKVTEPIRPPHVTADILEGEPRVGDEAR